MIGYPSNYPRRYRYRGIAAHQRWMRDVLKWRKGNRIIIGRLG